MKYIIYLCLIGLSVAAPQKAEFRSNPEDVEAEVTHFESDTGPEHGQFRFAYKTTNGLDEEREGRLLDEGGQEKNGYFVIPMDDGQSARFDFTAGLGGYLVHSDFLHPMPAHALEQIRMAEELRSQGVEWDEQGFRI